MATFSPTGTGVAIITPFRNHEVDYDALTTMIEHVISGGVEYIVSLGTTGETTSLSESEQQLVQSHTIEVVMGRVPIVAGQFGGNNTAQLVEKLTAFDPTGIAAILSSSPAYVKPSQEGIYQHYMALGEATPLPMIIYNVPGRTASNITADTTLRIANGNHNFIAVKDASADLVQGAVIARNAPSHFCLLSGDDPTALPLITVGSKGVISVIANAFPREFSDMIRAALAGDSAHALELHCATLDLHHWLYVEGNPVGIKEVAAHLGLIQPELRLPLVRMSEKNRGGLMKQVNATRSSVSSNV